MWELTKKSVKCEGQIWCLKPDVHNGHLSWFFFNCSCTTASYSNILLTFFDEFFSKFHYCDIEGNLPVMVYDYTAMIIILVLDFFCYQKEKYWTKLFSNVQQRLSYSSSNSWLLQMSCTTILSVSSMGQKTLWIRIHILIHNVARYNLNYHVM